MAGTTRRIALCLPAAAAALALAPAAHAATLTVDYNAGTFTYAAGLGEANRLSLVQDDDAGTYTFSDPGASVLTVTALGGPSCAQSGTAVTCSSQNIGSGHISLGDYNDTLAMTAATPVTAEGGNGVDTLQTGSGADTLNGGNGPDVLVGGGGGDTYVGGNGPDTADYSAATSPVTVTEDGTANDGADGRDNVGSDIETVLGGSAGDTLYAGPNGATLAGGPGDDALYGGDEDDTLIGGAGTDRFSGAAGDDKIEAQDGSAEQIDCGDGADTVSNDLTDSVAANCETRDAAPDPAGTPTGTGASGDRGTATGAPDIVLPVRPVTFPAPNVLRVKLSCAADAPGPCRGDVYVSVPARYVKRQAATHKLHAARGHYVAQTHRIAHRRFHVARGKTLTARVRVALRGHYVLRNRRRIRGKLRVVQRDAAGKVLGVTTRPIVLERKWSRRNRRSR